MSEADGMNDQQGVVGKCKFCGKETNTLFESQEDADEEISICDPCYHLHVSDSDE